MAIPSIGSSLTALDEELDEHGQPKVKAQSATFNPLPLTNANQDVALQPPKQASTGTGTFDANKPLGGQVIERAQQTALQGPQTQTQNLVSKQTQNLLSDPNAGVDLKKFNQNQMESFDFNQQKALEAQRQKTADLSNTGKNMYDLTDLALKSNLDRSGLSAQLETQAQERNRANLVSALAEGRSTAATEQAGFGSQMAGFASAQQTGAQASDQSFQERMKGFDLNNQKELMGLQADIDSNKLMKSQDFDRSMELLNQEFQTAMANGDRAQQVKILQMQDELEAKRLEKQQEYQTAERVATQAFTSSERVSDRDFQVAQTLLDQKFQAAQQTNDIDAQKYLQGEQLKLQLAMQTNGFNDAEKKMYLAAEIQKAKDQGDYEKTLALQNAANEYDFTRLQSTQGHDVAMADLNNKFATALQSNDFAQATALQEQLFAQQTKEAAKDRSLEQIRVSLQAKGLDMQQWQQNYDAIMAQEEAGTAQPGAARAYLNEQLQGTGVQLEAPDPADEFKAINDQFKIARLQYLATHPDQATLSAESLATIKKDNPTFTDKQAIEWATQNNPSLLVMTPEALSGFNSVMNETTYGEAQTVGESLVGKTGDAIKTTIDNLLKNNNPDEIWETYSTKAGTKIDPATVSALINAGSAAAKTGAIDMFKNGVLKMTPDLQTVMEKDGLVLPKTTQQSFNDLTANKQDGDASKGFADKLAAELKPGKMLNIDGKLMMITGFSHNYVDPWGTDDWRDYELNYTDTSTGEKKTVKWKQGDY